MSKKEYKVGSVILKTREGQKLSLKVFKCPYIDCDKQFVNQSDLRQHLEAEHNETLNKLKPQISLEHFNLKKELDSNQALLNRQKIKKYMMVIKEIFSDNAHKR